MQLQVKTHFGVTREIYKACQIMLKWQAKQEHKMYMNHSSSLFKFAPMRCYSHLLKEFGAPEQSVSLWASDLYKNVDAFAPCLMLNCGLKYKEAYLRCLYFADCCFESSSQESKRWFSIPDVCNHHFTSSAASVSTQCRFLFSKNIWAFSTAAAGDMGITCVL